MEKKEGQSSQLDLLMGTLTEVYQELNRISFRGGTADAGTGGEALARLQEAAGRVEGPLARWAAQITTGGAGITADGTRAGINSRWQSAVLPFCTQATSGRYPFDRRAAADIGMQDFAKLFGPAGLIDGFFSENLKDLVDTSTRPWNWKPVNGADLGISPAVLEQLQKASDIRDAFFAGNPAPKVEFQITPVAIDPNAEVVSLLIDGQQIDFSQNSGQPMPAAITWPGAVGLAQAGFTPPLANGESQVSKDGPWGWFRLLDGAEVRDTKVPDRKRIIFNIGGRIAIFQMQTGSVVNPFALPALSTFSCPSSF